MACLDNIEDQFFGLVSVGERGQIVIPAEARKRYNIHNGDKLLVVGHPPTGGVLLCQASAFREFLTKFLEGIDQMQSSEDTEDSKP